MYQAQIRPRLERAFGDEQVSYELVVPPLPSDDQERHYAVHYQPGLYHSSTVVVVVVVDITERKRAEVALRQSAERLQHLRAIDQSIIAGRSLDEIAEAAAMHIEHLIPTTQIGIMLMDPGRQSMTSLVLRVCGIRHTPADNLPSSLASFGAAVPPLLQGQIYQVDDVAALPELPACIHAEPAEEVRAYFHMPIMAGSELIALLNVASDQPRAFSAGQIEIVREVADQLSVAIQQARLRAQVERYAQDLEQRVADRTAELTTANKEL